MLGREGVPVSAMNETLSERETGERQRCLFTFAEIVLLFSVTFVLIIYFNTSVPVFVCSIKTYHAISRRISLVF